MNPSLLHIPHANAMRAEQSRRRRNRRRKTDRTTSGGDHAMSALNRTGRHNHMRPVVRPLPRPGVALCAATTW